MKHTCSHLTSTPLKHRTCALTVTKDSCPDRHRASCAKWQTGCQEHFHPSEALISLPSLLFIFSFASSLSCVLEIICPVILSRLTERAGRLRRWACYCVYSSTCFVHQWPIHPFIASLHLSCTSWFTLKHPPHTQTHLPHLLLSLLLNSFRYKFVRIWHDSQIPGQEFIR